MAPFSNKLSTSVRIMGRFLTGTQVSFIPIHFGFEMNSNFSPSAIVERTHLSSVIFSHSFMKNCRRPPTGI